MKNSTFEKQEFTQEENNQEEIKILFNALGFTDFTIQTSFANGLSHYITMWVDVLNENKTYRDMFVYENKKSLITVRISDHLSGLELNCGGVSGNNMTLDALKKLINTGAIKSGN